MYKGTTKQLRAIAAASFLMLCACTILPQQPLDAGQALPKGWIHFPLKSPKYDVPPRFVSGEVPIYPVRELLDGKPGVAVVRYTIGTDGRVHDAKVLFSSNRYFGTDVLYAMSDWIFKPAQKDGSPVPMIITQPMRFSAN
jgi:TonB family protein